MVSQLSPNQIRSFSGKAICDYQNGTLKQMIGQGKNVPLQTYLFLFENMKNALSSGIGSGISFSKFSSDNLSGLNLFSVKKKL